MAPTEYIKRLDNFSKIILITLIYWNQAVPTARQIMRNKPDITVIDKHEQNTYLDKVTAPASKNLQK